MQQAFRRRLLPAQSRRSCPSWTTSTEALNSRGVRRETVDLLLSPRAKAVHVLHSLQAAQGCSGALLSFGCGLVNEVHVVGDRLEVPVDEGRPKASISSKPHIDSVT